METLSAIIFIIGLGCLGWILWSLIIKIDEMYDILKKVEKKLNL